MLVNARNQMLFLEMIKEDKTTEARAISVNGNFVEHTRKLKRPDHAFSQTTYAYISGHPEPDVSRK